MRHTWYAEPEAAARLTPRTRYISSHERVESLPKEGVYEPLHPRRKEKGLSQFQTQKLCETQRVTCLLHKGVMYVPAFEEACALDPFDSLRVPPEGWCLVSDARKIVDLTKAQINTLARAGKIECIKLGRRWWVDPHSITAYLSKLASAKT